MNLIELYQEIILCTQIGDKKEFVYFERTPNGKISIRPFNGVPITGSKLFNYWSRQ